jgi:DNA-binding PadR family transcriptional regulator
MRDHGFSRQILARLVRAGLATVVTETMRAGARTAKVERYRITDDGRKALQ